MPLIERIDNRSLGFRFFMILFVTGCVQCLGVVASHAGEFEARVADLLENRCARAGCHAGPVAQQGMDLSAGRYYRSLVGVPSEERPDLQRVHPGQPDASYMMMKLTGAPGIVGAQMPLIGDKLTDEEIGLIAGWIAGIGDVQSRDVPPAVPSVAYPFDSWKIVNLPTARAFDTRNFIFLISHRFNPKISDGYDAFFGIDGSGIILLALGYAVTDDLSFLLGRTNSEDNVELEGRYIVARQSMDGGWPVNVGLHGVLNWVTQEPPPGEDRFRGEAFKFTAQVTVAREMTEGVGVAVVPGVTFNPAEKTEDEDALFTLGLGARWRFTRHLGVVAEWVPIVSGYTRTSTFGNDIRFDSWGGGLEITTTGHVFQIILSNTVGLASDQYLRGGDLDIRDGHMRLGFNIIRILNFF